MTTDQLITEWQDYYSHTDRKLRYSKIEKKYISQWLNKRTDRERKFLTYEVMKILSKQYRMLPDIEVMEQAYQSLRRDQMDKLYPLPRADQLRIDQPRMSEAEAGPYLRKLRDVIARAAARRNYNKRRR